MQKYLVNTAGMSARTASAVMTVVLFCYMVIQPLFGTIADRIGRRNSMIAFGTLMVVATVPLLSAIGRVTSPYPAFALILLALAFVSFYTSISGLVKAELSRWKCARSAWACRMPSPTRSSAAPPSTSRYGSSRRATSRTSTGTSPRCARSR
jgi:MHS family alpha-ketoglutarate permease-like MFS transporter